MKNLIEKIETDLGVYEISLITETHIYYVNEHECDENACVIMHDRNNKVISDNYFAFSAYLDDLEDILYKNKKYIFVKDDVLKYAREYFKNN